MAKKSKKQGGQPGNNNAKGQGRKQRASNAASQIEIQEARSAYDLQATRFELAGLTRATEALSLFGQIVDPYDAVRDEHGDLWDPIGATFGNRGAGFATEMELTTSRNICRNLAFTNEFAINGHENRISYIVGTGHTYTVVAKRDATVSDDTVKLAQSVIDKFVKDNRWCARQQEIVRRIDRDGEAFLRLFIRKDDAALLVRFVEPDQVSTPNTEQSRPNASFGIETEPDDVETVIAYWIDGESLPASEIQHRKGGVDANVKRGVPLFYPVHGGLRRAEKIQRNMDDTTAIQTAIAMIRKRPQASKTSVQGFVTDQADVTVSNTVTGKTTNVQDFGPGTILDVPLNTEYEFPSSGLDASRFVPVLQSRLRSVAARLNFPEFMLTADASNANYSSTLVAEGPAVKQFQRLQATQEEDDLEIMWMAVGVAVEAGVLPENIEELVKIQVGKPRVMTRDEKQEAEVNEIYNRMKIKSPQTISGEIGLDWKQEHENLMVARDADMEDFPALFPPPGDDDDDEDADRNGDQDEGDDDAEQQSKAAGSKQEVETVPELTLNGAQITAAAGIVGTVAKGELPRDSGIAQLEVLLNLSEKQADRIMGSVGAGFKPAGLTATVQKASLKQQKDEENGDGADDSEDDTDGDDADDS